VLLVGRCSLNRNRATLQQRDILHLALVRLLQGRGLDDFNPVAELTSYANTY